MWWNTNINIIDNININYIISLLKQVNKGQLMTSFEHFYIQSHYYYNKLISEQNTAEWNPMYQLVFDIQLRRVSTWPRSERLASCLLSIPHFREHLQHIHTLLTFTGVYYRSIFLYFHNISIFSI
jgi:hypothetical protein